MLEIASRRLDGKFYIARTHGRLYERWRLLVIRGLPLSGTQPGHRAPHWRHASIRTQTKPFSSQRERVPPLSIMDAIEFVDILYLVIAKAYNAVTDAFHRFRITYDGYRLITEDFMVLLDFEERQQLRYDLVEL
jgi:hypothetical protein